MRGVVIFSFVLFLVLFGCSENPSEPDSVVGNITGIVTDANTGELVAGVTITTSPASSSYSTDANGQYTVPGLDPGSYTVTATKAGFAPKSTSVVVQAKETTNADIALSKLQPGLQLSVTNLNFGTSNSSLTFTITNSTGIGELQWVIEESATWMSVNPTTGSTTTDTDLITVTADRSGQGIGNYNSQISVSSNGGSLTLDVVMSVPNPDAPQLTVNRLSIDFGDEETAAIIEITNTGVGSLQWSITEGYAWLTVNPTNGSTTTEIDQVFFIVDRSTVSIGSYDGLVAITSQAGGNAGISVTMEVTSDAATPVTLSEPTDVTQTSASLAWSRSLLDNFDAYRLYRSSNPGVSDDTGTMVYEGFSQTDNTYIDASLQPGQTYYYKVYVYTIDAASAPSNEVSATTPSPLGNWSSVYSNDDVQHQYCVEMISENAGFVGGSISDYSSFIRYWNGSSMHTESLPDQSDYLSALYDLAFHDLTDGYAVIKGRSITANDSYALHYDGTSWVVDETVPSSYDDLYCVASSPNGEYWFGGNIGSDANAIIKRLRDGVVTSYELDSDAIIDIQVVSENSIYCLSSDAKLFRYDGFGWSLQYDFATYYSSMFVISESSIYVWAGATHDSMVYRYNGSVWEELLIMDYGTVNSVWANSDNDVWLGGYSLRISEGDEYSEFIHYDGSQWQLIQSPAGNEIEDIKFTGNVGWAVDKAGSFLRYSLP